MKNFKEQKGITLVALVVTIIVLLILAGVTILYLVSDDGVFGQAESASGTTRTEVVKEMVMTAILQAQSEVYDPSSTAQVNTNANVATFINGLVKASGATASTLTCDSFVEEDDDGIKVTGTVTFNGKTYNVNIDTTATGPKSEVTE